MSLRSTSSAGRAVSNNGGPDPLTTLSVTVAVTSTEPGAATIDNRTGRLVRERTGSGLSVPLHHVLPSESQ